MSSKSTYSLQDEPSIGANISNTVSYTIMIGSLHITKVQCNTSNQQCTVTAPGSQLTEDGLLNVSVVASNAVGSGDPANFPTTGSLILKFKLIHLSSSSCYKHCFQRDC